MTISHKQQNHYDFCCTHSSHIRNIFKTNSYAVLHRTKNSTLYKVANHITKAAHIPEYSVLKISRHHNNQSALKAYYFEQEARILRACNSAHLPRCYGFGYSSDLQRMYIHLEYIPHHNLLEFLNKALRTQDITLSGADIYTILLHVLTALNDLYTQTGVYAHRDIKLENILVGFTPRVHAWLIDCGVARTNTPCPHAEYRIGTPSYCSPEQLENPQNSNFQSDIYSLGVVLYELLSFSRYQPKHASPAYVQAPPPSKALKIHDGDYKFLAHIIQSWTHRHAGKRPQHIQHELRMLRHALRVSSYFKLQVLQKIYPRVSTRNKIYCVFVYICLYFCCSTQSYDLLQLSII